MSVNGKVPDHYFEEPMAGQLEGLRHKARETEKLTYDCSLARVTEDHRVVCSAGHRLRSTGSGDQPLVRILRGGSCQACHKCDDFETDWESL